jgi:NAD(P)-dependent dehydrogenase (short-subunit alcohol dehydrogenase family)
VSALVVGGTRGIGRAVALRLAEEGFDVGLSFLSNETAARQAQDGLKTKSVLVAGDMSDPAVVSRAFDEVEGTLGPVTVVVHAAVIPILVDAMSCRVDDLDRAYKVGPRAFMLVCQEAGRRMAPGGRIVMVSSIAVGRSSRGYAALGAAKSAQEYLVRSFGVELAPRGICVNAVRSATIDGAYVAGHSKADQMRSVISKKTPTGQIGTEADVAAAVSFLCSEDARFVVGQCFAADGGFTIPL